MIALLKRLATILLFMFYSVFFVLPTAFAEIQTPEDTIFSNPDFFPLGVWLQSPDNALEFSELGINLFIGLWKGPTEAQLKELKSAQMRVIAAQNDVALGDQNNDIIVGWLVDAR